MDRRCLTNANVSTSDVAEHARMYARAIVGERDTPAIQWIIMRPLERLASSVNLEIKKTRHYQLQEEMQLNYKTSSLEKRSSDELFRMQGIPYSYWYQ